MNEVRISVALITRNGPERLRRCLQSLREQNRQPFEVVISDDSVAGCEYAIQNQKVSNEFGCRYVAGPGRGLYANRNHAALACTGTHIRTMDDDHTFPEGHWEICEAAVRSDPLAFWSTGEIGFLDGNPCLPSETAIQLHPSGLGCYPTSLDDNWVVADGSTTFPARIFASGHRMIEDFDYGSAYLEFGAYLYRHGYVGKCILGAQVRHHATMQTQVRQGWKITESRIFAVLAYNLHFRRSIPTAWKYVLACLIEESMNPALILRLPRLVLSVQRRWSALRIISKVSLSQDKCY